MWISEKIMQAVKMLACPKNCVNTDDIIKFTKINSNKVVDACQLLEKHGYLTHQTYSDGTAKPGCYVLTGLGKTALIQGANFRSGPKQPHGKPKIKENTLRDRAWRLLRIRRKASIPELIGLLFDAETDDLTLKKATKNLQQYMLFLRKAGYLSEMRREAPEKLTSNGAKRFFLIRDTGVLPPVPQVSQRKVLDQNEGKQYEIV